MEIKNSKIKICLVEPEIPPNTGNIARLCAATFTDLHIVGATGFRLDEKAVKRAGLDYWGEVKIYRHLDLDDLYKSLADSRFLYFTTKVEKKYTDWQYQPNDCLVLTQRDHFIYPFSIHNFSSCLYRLQVNIFKKNL